jgi:hypothetical protein
MKKLLEYEGSPDISDVVEWDGSKFVPSNLNLRTTTVSNFASSNAGGIVVGNYYDNSLHDVASSATLTSAANRIHLAPFFTAKPLRIDQLGIIVTTAAAGAARAVIYDSNADNWPNNLLLTVNQGDTGTTGWRGAACDFTFESGLQYWLGFHTAAAPVVRGINTSSSVNLGLTANNATNYFTMLQRTVTYSSGAPNPWTFVASDLAAGVPPSIRMRAAAI